MTEFATKDDAASDLLKRGYARRDVARLSALLAGAGPLAVADQALWAKSSGASQVAPVARIGTNESWVGPFVRALEAAVKILARCNFYSPGTEVADFLAAVAKVENVSPTCTGMAWFKRSALPDRHAFCSPECGLVTANPSYELPWSVSDWVGRENHQDAAYARL